MNDVRQKLVDDLIACASRFVNQTPPAAEWRKHVTNDAYQSLCSATWKLEKYDRENVAA